MPQEPESIGTGLGPLLADYLPLMPSGARRAGAARVMAARVGREPSFLVNNPIKTQLAAMGLGAVGNVYTAGMGKPTRISATVLPLLLVQALRRREIKSIQKDYDTEDRKRLRELDKDDLFGGWGGSSRLGAVGAYEAMRKRKYQDIGHLSEAGDTLNMMSTGSALPLINWIDHQSADRLSKAAAFEDQKNSPTIPLYLASALLAMGGSAAASAWLKAEDRNTPTLDKKHWSPLVHHVAGNHPAVFSANMPYNAYHTKPRTHSQGVQLTSDLMRMENAEGVQSPDRQAQKLYNRVMSHGAVVADENSPAGTLAHEGGHARIENTPGMLRFLQRHVYPHRNIITPLTGAGSMAAGLASGSTLKGALLGTAIGAIGGAGTIAPEVGASYYGLKGLKSYRGGALSSGQTSPLAAALSTYLAAVVLPSTLAGAAGGYVSGRRKRNHS